MEATRNKKGLERYNGFKRKEGTTIQQEKRRQETMDMQNRQRATKFIMSKLLKQMTLDKYQRKFNKLAPERINVSWGNTLSEMKGRLDCRILFLNVNGIQHTNDYAKLFEIGEELVYNDVDITCMVETKLNWQNQKTRRSCE